MRALIVMDVEIQDGQRPGTRYARLEWVARSVARFIGIQRRVRSVNKVSVFPGSVAAELPPGELIAIKGQSPEEETTWAE